MSSYCFPEIHGVDNGEIRKFGFEGEIPLKVSGTARVEQEREFQFIMDLHHTHPSESCEKMESFCATLETFPNSLLEYLEFLVITMGIQVLLLLFGLGSGR